MLLQDIALTNHAIFFDVVMHPFTVEFEPKQALWVVADVHGRVSPWAAEKAQKPKLKGSESKASQQG